MTLKVCVGSSCHLKGSYAVIEELKKLLPNTVLKRKSIFRQAFVWDVVLPE